jgi:hypothetical protein
MENVRQDRQFSPDTVLLAPYRIVPKLVWRCLKFKVRISFVTALITYSAHTVNNTVLCFHINIYKVFSPLLAMSKHLFAVEFAKVVHVIPSGLVNFAYLQFCSFYCVT